MTDPRIPVALSLGSNSGDRLKALRAAVAGMRTYIDITGVSPVYEMEAASIAGEPPFLNAALVGTTRLQPVALLWVLRDLEIEIGRTPTYRFGPRVIDIDILFYGDTIIRTTELIVPHPHMVEREFVLRPLSDIAPDWEHPQTHMSIAAMLALQPESAFTKLSETLI